MEKIPKEILNEPRAIEIFSRLKGNWVLKDKETGEILVPLIELYYAWPGDDFPEYESLVLVKLLEYPAYEEISERATSNNPDTWSGRGYIPFSYKEKEALINRLNQKLFGKLYLYGPPERFEFIYIPFCWEP